MKFLCAFITDRGGRDGNQDCVRVVEQGGAVCAAVCDGLGAYAGSDRAAELCADSVTTNFLSDPARGDDAEKLRTYIRRAHDVIAAFKAKTPEAGHICTTVACAVADEYGVAIAHIGDSRVYAVRDGKLELLTRDHSLARIAVDRGEITMDGIRRHKDQNKLTRVLGNDYYVSADCDVLPPLKAGDGLILCSDGVWEYVYDEDMERLFVDNDPQTAIQAFVQLIDERKPAYNDNYTAAVIKAVAVENE